MHVRFNFIKIYKPTTTTVLQFAEQTDQVVREFCANWYTRVSILPRFEVCHWVQYFRSRLIVFVPGREKKETFSNVLKVLNINEF